MKKKSALSLFFASISVVWPYVVFAEKFTNPLGSTNTPDEIVVNLIKTILGLVGAITLLVFVYGGFLFLTSAGQAEKIQKGRDTLMWATIGLIIIFGSYGISRAVFQALGG